MLKAHLATKHVPVIFDGTPNVEGKCVLNILIPTLKKEKSRRILTYLADLADTVFLEECNHSTVSIAVVKCLQEYSITNEDVIVFDTNNAVYMKKAYKVALQSLSPHSLYITCMAHIINLTGDAFHRSFDHLNALMLCFTQMFFQAGFQKRRHLNFMTRGLPTGRKATMAPNLCAIQWNSWFSIVQYHSQHFGLYKEFIDIKINVG